MTIPQSITNGYISSYLAAKYNATQWMFGGAQAAPTSPVTILMVTDALYWGYSGGAQTAQTLKQVANYLKWLCGKFGLEASYVSGTGGSVIPITPIIVSAPRIDFIVSPTSIIPTGDSTATFTQYIGLQLDFIRGGVSQSTLNSEPSYFTFNTNTGDFSCSPALVEGELISIIPS